MRPRDMISYQRNAEADLQIVISYGSVEVGVLLRSFHLLGQSS